MQTAFSFADSKTPESAPLPITLSEAPRGFSARAEAIYIQPHSTGGMKMEFNYQYQIQT